MKDPNLTAQLASTPGVGSSVLLDMEPGVTLVDTPETGGTAILAMKGTKLSQAIISALDEMSLTRSPTP